MKRIIIIGIALLLGKVYAQDRLFTYTYQSPVLNKGQQEIEIWSTLSTGRENFYRSIGHRLEFEVGLGKKVQTAFYLNYTYATGIETSGDLQSVKSQTGFGFSNEWKISLTDPVANQLGSGLYFEYGIGPEEIEFEGKLILDKQIGRSLHALNIVGEYEIEKEFEAENGAIHAENEAEPSLEFDYGYSYRAAKNISLGFEAVNQTWFSVGGQPESSLLWIGPCFSYHTDGFWINATLLPQIANLRGNGLELTDHEKLQVRLLFSFAL